MSSLDNHIIQAFIEGAEEIERLRKENKKQQEVIKGILQIIHEEITDPYEQHALKTAKEYVEKELGKEYVN